MYISHPVMTFRLVVKWPDAADEILDLVAIGADFEQIQTDRDDPNQVLVMIGRRVPESGCYDYRQVRCDRIKIAQYLNRAYSMQR